MNQTQAEEMAYIICEMAGKPASCRECLGRKSGCFTIPKMKKLIKRGYGKTTVTAIRQDKSLKNNG